MNLPPQLRPCVQVTPEMIEAGYGEFFDFDGTDSFQMLAAVYIAMRRVELSQIHEVSESGELRGDVL